MGSAPSRRSAASSAAATSPRSSPRSTSSARWEIVLVAQDLASYGKDRPDELGAGAIVPLVRAVGERVPRVRLLYLYPSDLSDELIDVVCDSSVPYFDLSLQHVSKPLLRRMRRWGDGDRFLRRIADIRARRPDAAFRSNFIVGYPGETEDDHDQLLRFVEEAQLDWCGFFAYSREDGTYAAGLDGQVASQLVAERLGELTELQDAITAARRDALIGTPSRSSSTARDRSQPPRGTRRSMVSCSSTRRSPSARSPTWTIVDALGQRPHRRRSRPVVDQRDAGRAVKDVGTALATWANAITAGRLLLSPLMFWLIPEDDGGSWVAFVFWFLLSVSDFVDGYIARRRGPTRSGAFLDPLADKVLILGAMFTLVGRDVFWIVPVAIIAARELVISVYRSVIGTKGISMPASRDWPSTRRSPSSSPSASPCCRSRRSTPRGCGTLCLWAAVVLALYSGVQYFWRMHAAKARAVLPPDVSVV